MSDAHKYVGDPDFAPAPEGLYGKEHARERIGLIDEKSAFQDMPPWGDPAAMAAVADGAPMSFVMAPGKRPRNTNSPLLVMKDGQPFMGLSTPGGDQQLQSLLQVFLKDQAGHRVPPCRHARPAQAHPTGRGSATRPSCKTPTI